MEVTVATKDILENLITATYHQNRVSLALQPFARLFTNRQPVTCILLKELTNLRASSFLVEVQLNSLMDDFNDIITTATTEVKLIKKDMTDTKEFLQLDYPGHLVETFSTELLQSYTKSESNLKVVKESQRHQLSKVESSYFKVDGHKESNEKRTDVQRSMKISTKLNKGQPKDMLALGPTKQIVNVSGKRLPKLSNSASKVLVNKSGQQTSKESKK